MDDKPMNTAPDLAGTPMESATATTATNITAPPKPPRPLGSREQAKATLKEAFPDVDDNIIEAVLIASGGKIEPAFNALLGISQAISIKGTGMTDPSYKPEATDAVLSHGDVDVVWDPPLLKLTSLSRP
jgi:CUE domain